MERGTTIEKFYGFIDHILDNLDQNHPGRVFLFTMDNLSIHRNPLVMNRILNAGHCHRPLGVPGEERRRRINKRSVDFK
jgi:hypothetical protein